MKNTTVKLFLSLGVISCGLVAFGQPATEFDSAESINHLAIDLYKQVAENDGNIFLSPYSISTALAMVYGGARGATEMQMNDVLHFGGQRATHPSFSNLRKKLNGIQEKGDVQLSIANALWPQTGYPIRAEYIDKAKEFYDVNVEPIDFALDPEGARQYINGWASKQTHDKIEGLIPEGALNPLTRLVLANAIYFKADWEAEFDPDFTRTDIPFHVSDTQTVHITTMAAFDGVYAPYKDFRALELPYKGNDLSMFILLPNTTNGLSKLEHSISPQLLDTIGEGHTNRLDVISIPKFSFSYALDLENILSELGMPLSFSNQADLSGMTNKDLWLNYVLHKTSVTVAEKGTEAIAVTGSAGVGGIPKNLFIANHPFLFLIRENSTGTILFIGRVTDPSK